MIYETFRARNGVLVHLDDRMLPERGSEEEKRREARIAAVIRSIYLDIATKEGSKENGQDQKL